MSTQEVAGLRQLYATGSVPEAMLQDSPHDTKPAAREWHTACAQASNMQLNKGETGPFLLLLAEVNSLNTKEVKLLLRALISCKPAAAPEITSFVITAMRCIVRLELHKREKDLVKCLHRLWSEALLAQWNEDQKAEVPLFFLVSPWLWGPFCVDFE